MTLVMVRRALAAAPRSTYTQGSRALRRLSALARDAPRATLRAHAAAHACLAAARGAPAASHAPDTPAARLSQLAR
jgi:hypothetical protein